MQQRRASFYLPPYHSYPPTTPRSRVPPFYGSIIEIPPWTYSSRSFSTTSPFLLRSRKYSSNRKMRKETAIVERRERDGEVRNRRFVEFAELRIGSRVCRSRRSTEVSVIAVEITSRRSADTSNGLNHSISSRLTTHRFAETSRQVSRETGSLPLVHRSIDSVPTGLSSSYDGSFRSYPSTRCENFVDFLWKKFRPTFGNEQTARV